MSLLDNTSEPEENSGTVPFSPPDPVPPDSVESPEPFTLFHLGVLAVGFVAYGSGFLLLSRNHPTSAPMVIIGGIITMLASFFV